MIPGQSKQNKYTVYPKDSLIVNQGLDGTGTHSGNTTKFDTILTNQLPKLKENLNIDKAITKHFYNIFDLGIKQKIIGFIYFCNMEKLLEVRKKYKREKGKKIK